MCNQLFKAKMSEEKQCKSVNLALLSSTPVVSD